MLRKGLILLASCRGRRLPAVVIALAVASLTTATAVLGDGAPAAAATVTVQRGQNLTQIAAQLHTTVSALVAANHLADPDHVLAGQVLQVPGGGDGTGSMVVVVGRGDTLSSIAARYRSSVSAIASANGITDPNRVFAGSRLRVPLAAAPGMALASYVVPAGSSHYPAQLVAHPSRLSLLPDFVQAASTYGVPLSLLEAMCWWESGWQTSIVSSTGAIGVCQIEPSTAAFVNRYLVHTPLDARVASQNIALGAAYLASLLRATGGNVSQALAGYYQGLASVRQKGMLPSTVTYVRGIEAYAAIFAG